MNLTLTFCLNVIEEAPTAYDVDKVVERLEERTTFLKECTKYGNKDAEQQEKVICHHDDV